MLDDLAICAGMEQHRDLGTYWLRDHVERAHIEVIRVLMRKPQMGYGSKILRAGMPVATAGPSHYRRRRHRARGRKADAQNRDAIARLHDRQIQVAWIDLNGRQAGSQADRGANCKVIRNYVRYGLSEATTMVTLCGRFGAGILLTTYSHCESCRARLSVLE